ncbi:RagB/SusD family nutrient uptake outer membrane protein, partial [Hallella bergensis]|uniref:RagB/SusD family nutrient uptake outer membrane protein n=1 Tax=Hallella bergensis TaxID=242750 RepID=UPI0023EF6AE7
SRQSVKQVYERILEDLGEASKLLTDQVATDAHYASLQSVNALYARVYLYMEDWQKALQYAKLAIHDQKLSQGEDYLKLFDDLAYQGEAVLRLSGQDLMGGLRSFYESSCVPADTLLSLYDKEDIRLMLLNRDDTVKCLKYRATKIPDNQPTRNDPFVFRLSELYLTAAEAACNLGQYDVARTYVGAIISRAVGEQRSNDILSEYTDANLINLIRKERIKELCFEGHQLYDITRWKQDLVRENKTNSVVKQMKYPSDYFVLPIPQAELNANTNMQPNPTVNQ